MNDKSRDTHKEVANKALHRLERMYGLFGGHERETSTAALAEQLGVGISAMRADVTLWQKLDILETRSVFELRNQRVFYRFKIGLPEARTKLKAYFDSGKGLYSWQAEHRAKKRSVKADASITEVVTRAMTPIAEAAKRMAAMPAAETVAIVGEDAPAPMAALRSARLDEPEGLLEAARQYASRTDAVAKKVVELEQLGITIDHEAFRNAIKLDTDPVLDAVSNLLPYVERLIRANERLTQTTNEMRDELREKRREAEVLRKEYNDQKAANKRLSERNIALADAARGTAAAHA